MILVVFPLLLVQHYVYPLPDLSRREEQPRLSSARVWLDLMATIVLCPFKTSPN